MDYAEEQYGKGNFASRQNPRLNQFRYLGVVQFMIEKCLNVASGFIRFKFKFNYVQRLMVVAVEALEVSVVQDQ